MPPKIRTDLSELLHANRAKWFIFVKTSWCHLPFRWHNFKNVSIYSETTNETTRFPKRTQLKYHNHLMAEGGLKIFVLFLHSGAVVTKF